MTHISQEDRWTAHYNEILSFMENMKRRPSKYIPEDRSMIHWIKYNKRLIAKNELSEERIAKFNHLIDIANKYRRLNQYAYGTPRPRPQNIPTELSLF